MIDLAIVGGGPAGLATALHGARAGLACTVFEPRPAPIDKACGEGLMPPAVAALRSLGVSVPGCPFRGIRYLAGETSVSTGFPGGRSGLGVRRTDLHTALHKAVLDAGVEIVPEPVNDLHQVRARYLVGADGLHSRVRRLAGLEGPVRSSRRWGTRAHFAVAPWTDLVEVYWNEVAEAYVTPVAPDRVGVAVLSRVRLPFGDHLAGFPALLDRLGGADAGPVRGAGPLRQAATAPVRGRVLLVGDAAGYVDALTGEGLAISFACAGALVQRVRSGDPAAYAGDHRRITRRYRLLTQALLWAGERPLLRRNIVPLAARAPVLFRAAVGQLSAG